jgi:hypothetical protein
MADDINFNSVALYIDNTLESFADSLLPLINIASQPNKIELATLKFHSGKVFDATAPITLKLVISNQVPIFDYIIYKNLSAEQKKRAKWIVDTNRQTFTESQISFSCLFLYFMLVTRNKPFPSSNESIPHFLNKFMTVPMSLSDIQHCLSENSLEHFQHKWIKTIDISTLSASLQNRFKQGIAGMRLYAIFRDFIPDREISNSTQVTVDRLKKLAIDGPYWEMHSLFQTVNLISSSISANLNNLILECFSEEKIKELVKMKAVFKYPIYNQRAIQYKTWSDSFFDEFKTKVLQ